MGISLFEHNQTAYDAAVSMLDTAGKAAVIHPTGTGKSFIAFKLCEDHPQKNVCWLSPSEYIFYTQVENWKAAGGKLQDKNKEKDHQTSIIPNIRFYTYAKLMYISQDAFEKIQPDYIILDEFHRCGATQWGSGVKKLLELYPKAKVLGLSATSIRYLDNQRDMAWELFEGNIASELSLGAAVARGILPMPRYVLSAYSFQEQIQTYKTKIQQIRNKAVRDTAEKQLEALRRALERAKGLDEVFARHIEPWKEKEITEDRNTNKEADNKKQHESCNFNISSIKNSMEDFNSSSILQKKYGKYLVFCANYNHLNEMKDLATKWFAKVDKSPHIYTLYSECPETVKEFEAFKADGSCHLKLLYCIDMLNEGIHIEGIDGVILLRPTISPTIYKQQIGRALAAGGKKTPVIFDIVMNIENLFSIGAIEEEFREAVLLYRKTGQEDQGVPKSFQIIDEVQDCRKLFAKLRETLGASWDAMYLLAERYYKEHGHLNIPKRYQTAEGYSLGMWIAAQRNVYLGKTSGNLSELQIKKLSEIGMQWRSSKDRIWEKYYAKAVEYYQKYGNLRLGIEKYNGGAMKEKDKYFIDAGEITEKQKNTDNYASLSRWLAKLRAERNDTKTFANRFLMPERIAALDALGMVWDTPDIVWEQHYNAAEQYYKEHNNLDIPKYYVNADGIRLGRWIAKQRNLWQKENNTEKEEIKRSGYNKNCLTKQQIIKLSAIGMDWGKKTNITWEQSYCAALDYLKIHGNLDIPVSYRTADGYQLGRWIRRQKDIYSKIEFKENKKEIAADRSGLKAERAEKLKQIGVIKDNNSVPEKEFGKVQKKENSMEDAWEHLYQYARRFYLEQGHLFISKRYADKDGTNLGSWLQRQRANYRKGILTKDQIQKLDRIGMIWEIENPWEIGYQHAKQYFSKFENLSVPYTYFCEDGYRLGKWISNQRCAYHNLEGKRLDANQIQKLSAIGMLWNAKPGRAKEKLLSSR